MDDYYLLSRMRSLGDPLLYEVLLLVVTAKEIRLAHVPRYFPKYVSESGDVAERNNGRPRAISSQ